MIDVDARELELLEQRGSRLGSVVIADSEGLGEGADLEGDGRASAEKVASGLP
jgi:hypothetical protein